MIRRLMSLGLSLGLASIAHAAGGGSWLPRTIGDNSITPSMFSSGILLSSACPYSVDGDQTTTSTTFAGGDTSSVCSVTFTLASARTVTAVFSSALSNSGANATLIGCAVDGDDPGNDYVAFFIGTALTFTVGQRTAALAAGSHTIKLVQKVGAGTGTYRNRSLAVFVLRP